VSSMPKLRKLLIWQLPCPKFTSSMGWRGPLSNTTTSRWSWLRTSCSSTRWPEPTSRSKLPRMTSPRPTCSRAYNRARGRKIFKSSRKIRNSWRSGWPRAKETGRRIKTLGPKR
jgi:hypothetical protein